MSLRQKLAFLTVLVTVISAAVILPMGTLGGRNLVVASPPTSELSEKTTQLNYLVSFNYRAWSSRYDNLRKSTAYNWMDWSQDGCSVPSVVTYRSEFKFGCLRHDLAWRTLGAIDGATGRVWNERNRYAADKKFSEDNNAYCDLALSLDDDEGDAAYCRLMRIAYDNGLRLGGKNRNSVTTADRSSVTANPLFIVKTATEVGSCSHAVNSANQCLPINYLTLDGKPFAPQNIARLPVGLPVKLQVVRANHQSVGGAPSQTLGRGSQTGTIGNSGELLLRAKFPLRAATTSSLACPTLAADADDPDDSEVYANINGYPLITLDNTLKMTTVYVKVCRELTASEASEELLELLPVRAVYSQSLEPPPADPPHTWQTSIGGRVRHYENLQAGPSRCNPTAITLSSSYRNGAWASTDCSSTLRPGKYADYYTFTLTEAKRMQIDLKSSTDPYLFLVQGSVVSANSQRSSNDDISGRVRDSRIVKTLQPGDYTIVATTYSGRNVGSYRLRVNGETVRNACTPTTVSLSSTARSGAWTAQDCKSSRQDGSYVDYYTFTLTSRTTVQIDLRSRTDTYLYLINGASGSGMGYRLDDDDGGTGLNSRISSTLPAGTYTVAATTYQSNRTGTYTLLINRN